MYSPQPVFWRHHSSLPRPPALHDLVHPKHRQHQREHPRSLIPTNPCRQEHLPTYNPVHYQFVSHTLFLHAHLTTRNIPLNVNPIASDTTPHTPHPIHGPQSPNAAQNNMHPSHIPKNHHPFQSESVSFITSPSVISIPINIKASRYSWFIACLLKHNIPLLTTLFAIISSPREILEAI